MEPTNANFTPDNVMKVLANMSEQMKSMQNVIGEQEKRIQAQALTILELQRDLLELREDATGSELGLTERISNLIRNTNDCLDKHEDTLRMLGDGLLAESASNSDFQQYAGEFYDRVGEFNEELLNRVKTLEKHAGIAKEHGKDASKRVFVSPKFNFHPVSLGESSRPSVENNFLKELSDAEKERKVSTPEAVVVHVSDRGEEHKRVRQASNGSPLTSGVLKAIFDEATASSDDETF